MTRPKVPDDKRIRTAQACESCKRRKQKVSCLFFILVFLLYIMSASRTQPNHPCHYWPGQPLTLLPSLHEHQLPDVFIWCWPYMDVFGPDIMIMPLPYSSASASASALLPRLAPMQ